MFKNASGKRITRYRIPSPSQVLYEDGDLWDAVPLEYRAWDYPDMILSIIDDQNGSISYSSLVNILKENEVPVDLGYVLRGIEELVKRKEVQRIRGSDSRIKRV